MPECNCSSSGQTVTPSPECQANCAGCTWSHAIICSVGQGKCHFTGKVDRKNCTNFDDKTWNIDVIMDCGADPRALQFHCDDGSSCVGYEMTFNCDNT